MAGRSSRAGSIPLKAGRRCHVLRVDGLGDGRPASTCRAAWEYGQFSPDIHLLFPCPTCLDFWFLKPGFCATLGPLLCYIASHQSSFATLPIQFCRAELEWKEGCEAYDIACGEVVQPSRGAPVECHLGYLLPLIAPSCPSQTRKFLYQPVNPVPGSRPPSSLVEQPASEETRSKHHGPPRTVVSPDPRCCSCRSWPVPQWWPPPKAATALAENVPQLQTPLTTS